MKNKQLADLGHGIYLGNWEACLAMPDVKSIHISGEEPSLCGAADRLIWIEKNPLSTDVMQYVADVIKEHEQVVVHCQAGMNRSPTLAFLALLLRGETFQAAYLTISRAMLLEYVIPTIPYWQPNNLRRIMLWVESKDVNGFRKKA